MRTPQRRGIGLWVLVSLFATPALGDRIKDIADFDGARSNQLVGYGVVVGLAGTGDDQSARFSSDSVVNMLERLGTNIDTRQLRLRNVAAVMITADLPAFTAPGQRIDVTVSSLGTAKSLEGGTLLLSSLKGVDQKVYALVQGPLSVGGFRASGKSGSSVQKNHPTVGRIPGGAIVEREVPVDLQGESVRLNLRRPDFTTISRVAAVIERALRPAPVVPEESKKKRRRSRRGRKKKAKSEEPKVEKPLVPEGEEPYALVRDSGTLTIRVPDKFLERVPALIAFIETLQVMPDIPTRVVINERTGTVVLGQNVRISPVAIAHGGLTIEVEESQNVSQPGAFSKGTTAITPTTNVLVREVKGELHPVSGGASLSDVVRALNGLGVTPRDLVAILQTLKTSGALHAELEIQ